MSAQTIATYGPLVIAAIIVVPVVIFLAAMLFEGRLAAQRGRIRLATRTPTDSTPLAFPVRRAASAEAGGVGGVGDGRVGAAPVAHD